MKKVNMLANVTYEKIDDDGLHINVSGEYQLLKVDNVVVCAGQVALRDMYEGLQAAGKTVTLVGGSNEASELDAKRAIKEASEWAAGV